MIYFSDVDVVRKLAACGFLPLLEQLLNVSAQDLEIEYLPSLKFRSQKAKWRLQDAKAQADLEAFCEAHRPLSELRNVEREQELLSGGMDPGEALLFADAESTGGIVITGDKRALAAYAKLSTPEQRSQISVICWEQLLLRVHELYGYEVLRKGCCAGMSLDKGGLSLLFSQGKATPEAHTLEGLRSFLRDVEQHSGDILFVF